MRRMKKLDILELERAAAEELGYEIPQKLGSDTTRQRASVMATATQPRR